MKMEINGCSIDIDVCDLRLVEELGKGINGPVNKMEHIRSGEVMAVKVGINNNLPPYCYNFFTNTVYIISKMIESY